jgi:hypothetical protein
LPVLIPVTAGARRLSLFENGALRKICGTKTIDVTRDWKKLHIEEFHEFCPSPSIVQVLKINGMGLAYSMCGERIVVYRVLEEKRRNGVKTNERVVK